MDKVFAFIIGYKAKSGAIVPLPLHEIVVFNGNQLYAEDVLEQLKSLMPKRASTLKIYKLVE